MDADGNGNVAGSASFKVDTRAPTVTEATLEQPLRDWTEPTVSGAGSAGGVVQYPGGNGNRAAAQRDGAAAPPGEASGDGHEELTLTWDEALDETSTPTAGAFTVRVDGERRALTGVTVRGRTVRLGLAQAAPPGRSVTVSYTAPAGAAARPIRDLAGNAAGDLTGAAVSSGAAAEAAGEREAYARVNRALLPNLVGALQASTQEAIGERELTAGGLSLAGRPVAGPETAGAGPWQEQQTAAGEPWEEPAAAGNIGVRELLEGSSFVLPLAVGGAGGEARAGSGGGVALWGRGDYRRLASGEEAEVEWSGGLLSVHVGADLRVVPELLAGVAVTWAQGGFDYTERSAAAAVSGEYEIELIGVYPYASWTAPGIGVGLWATAGYGWGEVAIAAQGEAQRKSGLRLLTGALAGSGRLLATERLIAGGRTLLRLKGSGEVARIEVEERGAIGEQELEVRRLRVALEGSHAQRLAWGGRLTPVLEVGVRYDEGAGTEGAGLELGGELRYVHPELGLTVAGHGRLLAMHQAGYEEWGAGGLIRVEQGAARRGLRLQAELGYGLALPEGSGVLTPYGVLTLAGAERDYRAGARLELEGFHLELEGRRREAAADAPEHDLTLRGGLRYRYRRGRARARSRDRSRDRGNPRTRARTVVQQAKDATAGLGQDSYRCRGHGHLWQG